MNSLTQRLQEIGERLSKAMPGKWSKNPIEPSGFFISSKAFDLAILKKEVDANFIVHSHSDIVLLLQIVEKQREVLGFYGNKENHDSRTETLSCGCCSDIYESRIDEDNGRFARECLAECEKLAGEK